MLDAGGAEADRSAAKTGRRRRTGIDRARRRSRPRQSPDRRDQHRRPERHRDAPGFGSERGRVRRHRRALRSSRHARDAFTTVRTTTHPARRESSRSHAGSRSSRSAIGRSFSSRSLPKSADCSGVVTTSSTPPFRSRRSRR